MANGKPRKLYMDLLRIIAILFVIFNHTGDKGYYLYAYDCPMILRIIYTMTGGMIAVAVPIFFMISGALLIPKNESIKDLYIKRVLRMVLILILFSVIQYGYQILRGEDVQISIRFFVDHTLSEAMIPQYWYLYSYLAYLICLPLIRKLALNMTDKEFKYLFVVFLLVEGVLPIILYLINVDEMIGFFSVPFLNRVIIYPLLGYYMEERVPKEKYNSKGMLKWIVLMLAVLVLITIMTIHRNIPIEQFTTYDSGLFTTGFTIILDIGVFYIVKLLFLNKNVPRGIEFVLVAMSSTVFGIYLIENIVRDSSVFIYDFLSAIIGKYLSAWTWCLAVLILSSIIIYVIKLIPGVKKLL